MKSSKSNTKISVATIFFVLRHPRYGISANVHMGSFMGDSCAAQCVSNWLMGLVRGVSAKLRRIAGRGFGSHAFFSVIGKCSCDYLCIICNHTRICYPGCEDHLSYIEHRQYLTRYWWASRNELSTVLMPGGTVTNAQSATW